MMKLSFGLKEAWLTARRHADCHPMAMPKIGKLATPALLAHLTQALHAQHQRFLQTPERSCKFWSLLLLLPVHQAKLRRWRCAAPGSCSSERKSKLQAISACAALQFL
eukprot:scaffold317552_cov23-Tisochrysis_lutea.AAC.1